MFVHNPVNNQCLGQVKFDVLFILINKLLQTVWRSAYFFDLIRMRFEFAVLSGQSAFLMPTENWIEYTVQAQFQNVAFSWLRKHPNWIQCCKGMIWNALDRQEHCTACAPQKSNATLGKKSCRSTFETIFTQKLLVHFLNTYSTVKWQAIYWITSKNVNVLRNVFLKNLNPIFFAVLTTLKKRILQWERSHPAG